MKVAAGAGPTRPGGNNEACDFQPIANETQPPYLQIEHNIRVTNRGQVHEIAGGRGERGALSP